MHQTIDVVFHCDGFMLRELVPRLQGNTIGSKLCQLCWRASNIGIFGLLINQLFALMGFDGLLAGLAYTTLQSQLQQQQQRQQQEESQQGSLEANEGDKGGIGAVIKRLENSASVR